MNNSQPFNVNEETAPAYLSRPYQKPPNHKKLYIVLIALLVIIILGGVGYWYHKDHKAAKTGNAAQKSLVTIPSATTSATTNYVSNGNDLNLTFSYPSSWSVSPTTKHNSNDQTITVTSPLTTILSAADSNVTGKIVVLVRPGSATVNELNANSPMVALASVQIAYSQPASDQYQYPYISYIHFSNASKVSGAFEEVMITGNQPLTQGQSLNATYLSGVDPIISANFYQCSTPSCSGSGQTPLSITNDTWQNATIFKRVLALLESFRFN